jgi:hypothetical protein
MTTGAGSSRPERPSERRGGLGDEREVSADIRTPCRVRTACGVGHRGGSWAGAAGAFPRLERGSPFANGPASASPSDVTVTRRSQQTSRFDAARSHRSGVAPVVRWRRRSRGRTGFSALQIGERSPIDGHTSARHVVSIREWPAPCSLASSTPWRGPTWHGWTTRTHRKHLDVKIAVLLWSDVSELRDRRV